MTSISKFEIRWQLTWCLVLIVAGSICTGCGPRITFVKTSGVVLLDDKPLANVLVTFVPDEKGAGGATRSSGMTDAEGKFTLKAPPSHEGAVLGRHRVILEDLAILEAPRSEDGTVLETPPNRVPKTYGDVLKTTLSVEVKSPPEPITLKLNSDSVVSEVPLPL
jgi:hypothetical protein